MISLSGVFCASIPIAKLARACDTLSCEFRAGSKEGQGGEVMLNPTEILADALGKELAAAYTRAFSGREPRYTEIIAEAARLVLERIGSSDALYHSAEHTAMVALVGQDILRGERLRRDVTAEDWLHFTLATLTHDVGYVRGICRDDRPDGYVIDATGKTVSLPRGASDAFLG